MEKVALVPHLRIGDRFRPVKSDRFQILARREHKEVFVINTNISGESEILDRIEYRFVRIGILTDKIQSINVSD